MVRAFIFVGLVCLAGPATADTGPVVFNGTVDPTCTLSVTRNGTMTVNGALQSLSSHNAGGQSGLVDLSTTGGVTLSVDAAVSSVTVPGADITATTWSPSYSSTGTHTLAEGAGSNVLATAGASVVAVHLSGTKSGADTFAGGAYQATVTLRCEP
jgi:hypothetical protein